jgi:hypothetical protein
VAKDAKGNAVTLFGGRNAKTVNPLGVTKQFKAVCITEKRVLSPHWRNTKAEAIMDAEECVKNGHYIDFEVRIGA